MYRLDKQRACMERWRTLYKRTNPEKETSFPRGRGRETQFYDL